MYERIRRVRRHAQAGFTLVELLVTIVILGVLAGIVVFSVSGINDRGQTSACKSDLKTVAVANEAYYAKNSAYATTVAALVSGGFLQSDPGDVTINVANPPTYTGVGKCAGQTA